MRRWTSAFFPVAVALTVSCGSGEGSPDRNTAVLERERTPQPKSDARYGDAWYGRQVKQDCVAGPYNEEAIEAVRRAHQGDDRQFVHGSKDPYERRWAVLQNLKTRANPRGEGVLVTTWKDTNHPRGTTNFTRVRYVWLVLESRVYPVNADAAGAIGHLFDGMPTSVQKEAGLVHTYESGRTMMDQLGIEGRTYEPERWGSGVNPFPMCN